MPGTITGTPRSLDDRSFDTGHPLFNGLSMFYYGGSNKNLLTQRVGSLYRDFDESATLAYVNAPLNNLPDSKAILGTDDRDSIILDVPTTILTNDLPGVYTDFTILYWGKLIQGGTIFSLNSLGDANNVWVTTFVNGSDPIGTISNLFVNLKGSLGNAEKGGGHAVNGVTTLYVVRKQGSYLTISTNDLPGIPELLDDLGTFTLSGLTLLGRRNLEAFDNRRSLTQHSMLQVYKRALSNEEIQSLHANPFTVLPDPSGIIIPPVTGYRKSIAGFNIGNSVTDTIAPSKLKFIANDNGARYIWARQVILGAPLGLIVENPAGGFVEQPYSYPTNAFPNYTWDVLSLQPFDRGLTEDLASCQYFIDLLYSRPASSNARVLIFSRWARQVNPNPPGSEIYPDYAIETLWARPASNNESKAYFESVLLELRSLYPTKTIDLVPVGDAMLLLDAEAKAGRVPGVATAKDLFVDGIHLGDLGQYLTGCVYYATMFREDPAPLGFAPYAGVTQAQADKIQTIAWATVLDHPYSGVADEIIVEPPPAPEPEPTLPPVNQSGGVSRVEAEAEVVGGLVGIAFPFEISRDGNLVTAANAELTRCHILAALQTEERERLGLPNFGLPDFLFRSYPDFLGVGSDVQARLSRMVPAAIFDVTSSLDDSGEGLIEVNWMAQGQKQEAIVATTESSAPPLELPSSPLLPSVTFTTSRATIAESGTATYTIRLSSVSDLAVSIPFTLGGNASVSDYSITASPVAINAGETSATVIVTALPDAIVESGETVVITLGAPANATLGAIISTTTTIDGTLALPTATTSSSGVSVVEGSAANYLISLSSAYSQPVTIPFTVSGTAIQNNDYTITGSPLLIPAGSTSTSLTVTTTEDAASEGSESVVVTFGVPTNATIAGSGVITTTITNGAAALPTITISPQSATVIEGASTTYTVAISAVSESNVIAPFVLGGSAVQGADYTITQSPLTITAGAASATIIVTALTDAAAEGGFVYVSDLTPISATTGYGEIGIDQSVDKNTLTLAGVSYAKGIGAHAVSEIVYSVSGYTTFTSDIGVDDEVGQDGSIIFQVWADGDKVYDSGVMTGLTATKSVSVSMVGVSMLRLVIENANDGIGSDHGDWANAKLNSATETIVLTLGTPTGATLGSQSSCITTIQEG